MSSSVLSTVLAQAWEAPTIDWHALAPELVLLIGINGRYDAHTGVRIAGLPGGD